MKNRRINLAVAPIRQPKGRGAQFVYAALRDRILRLDLQPGAKLDEAALVESLGVSRTPVREAFVRLAAEGLVFLLPNRGAQVAPLDLTETARYFEALDLVQRVVNNWAAVRRTDEDLDRIREASDRYDEAVGRHDPAGIVTANYDFHLAIATAGRNGHIEATLRRLLEQGMRLCWVWYQHFAADLVARDMSRSCAEHHAIIEAIASRDVEHADLLGHEHTESFRKRMKEYLDDNLAPTVAVSLGERRLAGKRRRSASAG